MSVTVEVLSNVSQDDAAAVARLIPQVSARVSSVSRNLIEQIASGPASCILVARIDGEVVGTATLLTLRTLVGRFGYVEEVVVDESARGRGVGTALMHGVLSAARDRGHEFVELTSRPSRTAANALYVGAGFELRETNVFRYDLR